MTFLPIVTRELRQAARRKSTFWIRAGTAAFALGLACIVLMMTAFGPSSAAGAALFSALSLCALLLALLGGIFLAADCLAQERREGTLGFLFLTDLTGYDVAFGKFTAVSLNAFYGLVAVFPVVGLSLLAGGVTGAEFARMCVALINALFFSVAAAIWISSRAQSASRSYLNAFAIIAIWLAAGAVADSLASALPRGAWVLQAIGAASPLTAFERAKSASYLFQVRYFWLSLGLSNLGGWLFLLLAAGRLKFFREQEETRRRSVFSRDLFQYGRKRRRRNLERNPILWLLDDSRAFRATVWIVAALGAAAMAAGARHFNAWMVIQMSFGSPFNFVLKLLFTIQACRFFVEARQTGALELLCSTPLSIRGMVDGQWAALRRIFLAPVCFTILAQFAAVAWGSPEFRIAQFFPNPVAVMLTGKMLVTNVADYLALGWFGMWCALTFRKPNLAVGATLLYVLVLPGLVFCIPSLAVDGVLGVVGYAKLRQEFTSHFPFRVYVPNA